MNLVPALRSRCVEALLSLPRRAKKRPSHAPGISWVTAVSWLLGATPASVEDVLAGFPKSGDEDTPEAVAEAITPQLLEALYEAVAWDDGGSPFTTRKAQGSFHTPTVLVYSMVRDVLQAALGHLRGASLREAVDRIRIVDPSVGPGSFLAGALRELRVWRQRAGLDGDVPRGALCGVDVSPLAIEVCRLRLALAGYSAPDLRVGDSLVDGRRFAWTRDFADVFAGGGFDVVIGNPPYLRDSRKKNLDAAALRQTYRAATSHYDLYVLFMERALQVVREGGYVSLLTSNRWLSQKYGRGIREILLENRLRGVLDLRFRSFDSAVVHTSITLVQRGLPAADGRTVMAVVDDVRSMHDASLPTLPQCELDAIGFRFDVDGDERALGARMRAGADRLDVHCLVTLGMVFHDPRPGGKRKADYLCARRGHRFTTPLLDGEHVGRWAAEGQVWLDYCPDEHREPRSEALFRADKVLCRRIIGVHRIMAMVDDEQRWFSDNVVGVVPYRALGMAKGNAIDVDYLAAILNSRLINWYHQKLQGFGMHLYPSHLKEMPLVVAAEEEQRALAALARRARTGGEARDEIEAEIDRHVERLYGLTDAERQKIARTCQEA